MKRYIIVSILLVGAVSATGYQKMCYVHPQYGRRGCLEDMQGKLGKQLGYDVTTSINYMLESEDGRRTCFIRLHGADRTRVRLVLDKWTPDTPINDEMIQKLLLSRKGHLKVAGYVLRDFKLRYPVITVQEIRGALALDQAADTDKQ